MSTTETAPVPAAPAAPVTETAPVAPPPPAEPAKDAPAAPPPAEPPKETANAARFAAAARKERELRQRERAIKEAEAKMAQGGDLREIAKKDPIKALEALGLTFDGLTNHVLDTMGPPKERTPAEIAKEAAAAEFTRLREEHDKAFAEEQSRNRERAEKQLRVDISGALGKAVDETPFLAWANDPDPVIEAMTDIFARDHRIPTVSEAAKAAETKLVGAFLGRVDAMPPKLKELVLSRLAPKPAAPKEPEAPVARTLTNRLEAAPATAAAGTSFDREEAFNRALRRMQQR